MNMGTTGAIRGLLLPESFLYSDFFALLAAFVAINTIMYVALAVAKLLPRVYVSGLFRRGRQRAEDRSIYCRPLLRETARPPHSRQMSSR